MNEKLLHEDQFKAIKKNFKSLIYYYAVLLSDQRKYLKKLCNNLHGQDLDNNKYWISD